MGAAGSLGLGGSIPQASNFGFGFPGADGCPDVFATSQTDDVVFLAPKFPSAAPIQREDGNSAMCCSCAQQHFDLAGPAQKVATEGIREEGREDDMMHCGNCNCCCGLAECRMCWLAQGRKVNVQYKDDKGEALLMMKTRVEVCV